MGQQKGQRRELEAYRDSKRQNQEAEHPGRRRSTGVPHGCKAYQALTGVTENRIRLRRLAAAVCERISGKQEVIVAGVQLPCRRPPDQSTENPRVSSFAQQSLIRRRVLHVIDHDHVVRSPGRFNLEPKLLDCSAWRVLSAGIWHREVANVHCNFAYSASACVRTGISRSAFFQSARKS